MALTMLRTIHTFTKEAAGRSVAVPLGRSTRPRAIVVWQETDIAKQDPGRCITHHICCRETRHTHQCLAERANTWQPGHQRCLSPTGVNTDELVRAEHVAGSL